MLEVRDIASGSAAFEFSTHIACGAALHIQFDDLRPGDELFDGTQAWLPDTVDYLYVR